MRKLIVICAVFLELTACVNSYKTDVANHKSGKSQKILKPTNTISTAKFAKNSFDCPIIGAIRWDAWYGNKDSIGNAEMMVLGPKHWHYRLPFCAEITATNSVKINCATQAAIDKEIDYAKQGGIDYWAFVAYDANHPLSLALNNYLSSPKKSEINFALITETRWWKPANYNKSIQYFIKHMSDSSYQKVIASRPLIYLLNFNDDWIAKTWKSDAAFKTAIREFRQQVQQSGLKNPYIVIMEFNPKRAKQLVDRFGFDASSTYAIPGDGGKEPNHKYKRLANNAKNYWDRVKNTDSQVVPTIMAGWDHRPRAENPVRDNWKEFAESDKNKYYDPPTSIELGNHVSSALEWVKSNSSHAEANTVIIYAWDEFSEGGWLAPTLSEGTARVDVLGTVIRRDCPTK